MLGPCQGPGTDPGAALRHRTVVGVLERSPTAPDAGDRAARGPPDRGRRILGDGAVDSADPGLGGDGSAGTGCPARTGGS